ncbi:unnamed protein product [Lota lota]
MPTAMGKWRDSNKTRRAEAAGRPVCFTVYGSRRERRRAKKKNGGLRCTNSWLSMSVGDEISNRRHGWFIMTIIRADKQPVHEKEVAMRTAPRRLHRLTPVSEVSAAVERGSLHQHNRST